MTTLTRKALRESIEFYSKEWFSEADMDIAGTHDDIINQAARLFLSLLEDESVEILKTDCCDMRACIGCIDHKYNLTED